MPRVLAAVYDLLAPDQRRLALGVLLLMVATAGFELIGIGSVLPFLSVAMDPAIIHRSEILSWFYTTLGFSSDTAFILFAGAGMLSIIVVMNLVSAFAVWTQVRFTHRFGHAISVRLMEHYLAKPYAYFLVHNTSELSKNVLDETLRVVTGVLRPGAALLSRGILVVAVVALLVAVEPGVTLLSLLFIGGANAVVYGLIRRRLRRLGRKSVEANRARFQTNAEAFGGIKEIQALGREAQFLRNYEAASAKYTTYHARNAVHQQLPRFLTQTIALGGFMVAFMILVASGQDLTGIVPLMGFFAFAALRLLPRSQEVLAALTQFRFHEHLLFKIHAELMEAEREGPVRLASRGDAPRLPFERAITMQHVRFRYPGTDKDVIRDLTLEIPRNSSVALVGTTGAGKTTIADILLGLHVPDGGAMVVDATPVTPANVAGWRRQVGYVPQDVFLTDDTVIRNIALGLEDDRIDREGVRKAASIAHIHDFIVHDLPDGYETTIGERGVRISGGQRQRIGIARALYHDPEVLVLDEATSDIDNVTEAAITEAIQDLAGHKTLVIIAHRLTTIQRCDRICVVEAGDIVASGSYAELIATSPAFQRLTRVGKAAVVS